MAEAKHHLFRRNAPEIESKRSGDELKEVYGRDSKVVKEESKPDPNMIRLMQKIGRKGVYESEANNMLQARGPRITERTKGIYPKDPRDY